MAGYHIRLTIPGLPRTANASRRFGHWAYRSRHDRNWYVQVLAAVTQLGRPPAPLRRARLRLERHSSQAIDPDNLVSSFKPIIDALIKSGVILNDKMKNIGMPDFRWEYADPGKGHITIEVWEDGESNA